jgi:hypothetical protein
LQLPTPPSQLISVGLYSHFLIISPTRRIPDSEISIGAFLVVMANSLRQAARPFYYEPLFRSSSAPASPTLPMINLDTNDVKPDPVYLRWWHSTQGLGWQIRILTAHRTKVQLAMTFPDNCFYDFGIRLIEPRIALPRGLNFVAHTPSREYTRLGFLLFSSPSICPYALAAEIILQLHASDPTLVWYDQLILIVAKVLPNLPTGPSPPPKGNTMAYWIECPPALNNLIALRLRPMFLQAVHLRPMGRNMTFVPTNFLPSTSLVIHQRVLDWQRLYWDSAERFFSIINLDPYSFLPIAGRPPISLRSFALGLRDPATNLPYYVAFDRQFEPQEKTAPHAGKMGKLFTNIYQFKNHESHLTKAMSDLQLNPLPTHAAPFAGRNRINDIAPYSLDSTYYIALQHNANSFVLLQRIWFPSLALEPLSLAPLSATPPSAPASVPPPSNPASVPPPSDPAPTTSPDATLSPEAPITPTPLSRTTTATAHDAKRRCVPDPDIHAAK